MKAVALMFCGSVLLLGSCSRHDSSDSTLQSIASDLSDTQGRLAKTFLYTIEGSSVTQRECTKRQPQSQQDCPRVVASQPQSSFEQAVRSDIDLSRNRLETSIQTLRRDRGTLQSRRDAAQADVKRLEQSQPTGGGRPSGEDPAVLRSALQFAEAQYQSVKAELQVTQDPERRAALQEAVRGFESTIADLKARLAAALGQSGAQESQALKDARARLAQAQTELDTLNNKLRDSEAQLAIVNEEQQLIPSTLDQLRASFVSLQTSDSFNSSQASKQLASRFHKLFTAGTPVCETRPVAPFLELSVGDERVFRTREAQVGGSWHFGEVVRQLLGGNPSPAQVENFLRNWVQTWTQEQRIGNGDRVAARPDFMGTIDQWKAQSQARGVNGLDLSLAPFRLIGIANRFDLRNPLAPGDAGEFRLAYSLLDTPTNQPQSDGITARPFTVIFEFRVNTNDLGTWLSSWHDLGTKACTNAACAPYVDALRALSRQITHRGEARVASGRLGQLRTNEIAFGNPWEQREFQLVPADGGPGARLQVATVKKTPRADRNGSAELTSFANSLSLNDILNNNYEMPTSLQAVKAQVQGSAPEWTIAGNSDKARAFNLNTCNGCHSSDQAVIDGFYHISPFQRPGRDAMSPFLKDSDLPKRARNLEQALVAEACQSGTPFDAQLARDTQRLLARPVH